ncbi:hypothetical protein A2V82_03465 [candidate division KSB1 bacterium RBG_16_48_16]|nr:MAG: hypothetical protein A2V82_03465 [candidate division KSB1 bacterium RBG_16_48_16]
MQHTIAENSYSKKLSGYFLLILLALAVSGAAWTFGSFDLKWAIFSLLGLIFPFALMLAQDVRRFMIGMLIFAIPLNADYNFMFHPSTSGADSFSVGLTDILLFILLAHWLFTLPKSERPGAVKFFPRISAPTLALLVLSAVSILAARDLLWSAFDLLNFTKTFLLFFYLANNIKSRRDISLVLNALFLGLIVQTVIVYLQYIKGSHLGLLGLGEASRIIDFEMEAANLSRPGGTIGHCNHLARYIGLIIPISIALLLTGETRFQRAFAGLTSLAGIVALIYTLTRSSWIALALSILVVLYLIFRKNLISMRTMFKISITAMAMAVIIALFSQVIWGRITTYDKGSAKTRITTAKVAWNIFQAHPLIGVGINNYGTMLPEYWNSEDSFTRRAAVHNTYLLYLAEIGIFGFAVFLWLLIAFYSSAKNAMASRSAYLKIVAIGIMGSFAGYLVSALGDKSYKENFTLLLVFWSLAAIIEAINRMNRESENIFYALLENEKDLWIPDKSPAL